MTVESFINKLHNLHVSLEIEGESLNLKVDKTKLSAVDIKAIKDDKQIIDYIKNRKEEIKEYLSSIPKVSREDISSIYKLSSLQEGIMFHSVFNNEKKVYVSQLSCDIENVDIESFKQSWRLVMRRHTILRSAFYYNSFSVPVQCVFNTSQLYFETLDYSSFDRSINDKIRLYEIKDVEKGFELDKPPLFRVTLIKITENSFRFILTYHHIILDGWSLQNLVNKVLKDYLLISSNQLDLTIPIAEDKYEDYVQYLNKKQTEKEIIYWKKYLLGYKEVNTFPFINTMSNSTIGNFSNKSKTLVVSEDLATQVISYSKSYQITLNTIMQACWAYLMYRYTDKNDVVFGITVSGRPGDLVDVDNRVGLYVNTIPFRTVIHDSIKIIDWLKEIQKAQFLSQKYQHVSLSSLNELSGIKNGLFDTLFVFENYPISIFSSLEHESLAVSNVKTYDHTNYPISVVVSAHEKIEINVLYNDSIINDFYIDEILFRYEHLLRQITVDAEHIIKKINFLTVEEEAAFVLSLPKIDAKEEKSPIELFEDVVTVSPQSIALEYGTKKITYQKLNEYSNQFANYLESKNVAKGDIVPLYISRGIDMIVSILSIQKVGAIYVPIDVDTPQYRVDAILLDINSRLLIVDDISIGTTCQNIKCISNSASEYKMMSTTRKATKTSGEDIFAIIYTSGSTSVSPNGVKILSKSVTNRIVWMQSELPFDFGEKVALKTSISFVDHIWEIFGPLSSGVCCTLFDSDEILDIELFIEKLKKQNVTRIVLAPSLLSSILDSIIDDNTLPDLKYWTCSGEVLSENLCSKFYEIFSRNTHRLYNIYGSTEVTADVTFYDTSNRYNKNVSKNSKYDFSAKIDGLIKCIKQREQIVLTKDGNFDLSSEYDGLSIEKAWTKDQYINFLEKELLPHIINLSHPKYIGHMTAPIPQFVKDINRLIIELNQNLVKIETSATATFIERQVLGVLHKQFFNISNEFYKQHTYAPNSCLGLIVSSGTVANITAISYALNNELKANKSFKGITEEGLNSALEYYKYKKVVVLASKEVHYSVFKAAQLLGIGKSNILLLDFSNDNHLLLEELSNQIENIKKNEILIASIIGVAGSTETGSIDALDVIGTVASKYNIHYHIDAAFGGVLSFCNNLANKLTGIDKANSITVCGHKQLFLPLGASCCLFRSPYLASYSENNATYQARKTSHDLGRFTLEGSRAFTALLFHSVFKIFGKEKIGEYTALNIERAKLFADIISENNSFQLMITPELNIICYRYVPLDLRQKIRDSRILDNVEIARINDINLEIQKKQFSRGDSFISYTRKSFGYDVDEVVLRSVVMNPTTTKEDFFEVLKEQIRIAREIEYKSLKLHQNKEKDKPEYDNSISKIKPVAIGRPIRNTQVYILNKHMEPCPVGIIGDIYISGMALSAGYVNKPELTREKFVINPFSNLESTRYLYKTGDRGKLLPDNQLEYIGRDDKQIKIQGRRVELGEIENILESLEGVKECVVIPQRDINGITKLDAYLTVNLQYNETTTREQLIEILPYYCQPSNIVYCEKLPLNVNGKVDRKLLAEKSSHTKYVQHIAPRNILEMKIAKIWSNVLNKKEVGVSDNFFTLGGHSLLVVRVLTLMKKELNIDISVKTFFNNPTISKISNLSILSSPIEIKNTVSIRKRPSKIPLSYAQERLWFIDQLQGSIQYHMPIVLELKGAVDVNLLEDIFNTIVERHEILRTVIIKDSDGIPYQHIKEVFDVIFTEIEDVSTFCDNELNDYIVSMINQPFDLSSDLAIRVELLQKSSSSFILIVNVHHIACDGYSLSLMINEFTELYKFKCKINDARLPLLEMQYADYSIWHREYVDVTMDKQLSYWKTQLFGVEPLNLPTDFQRSSTQRVNGDYITAQIDLESSNKVESLIKHEGVTEFTFFLTAFNVLLNRYTNQSDICIGTPIANRGYKDVETMVGFLANTIALRNNVDCNSSFLDLVNQVKATTVDAYENQDLPFEQILKHLSIERDLSMNPIFQVLFVFNAKVEPDEIDLADIKISKKIDIRVKTVQFDLCFTLSKNTDGYEVKLEYSTDLYKEQTAKLLLACYIEVLHSVLNNPLQQVGKINILPEYDKSRILGKYNTLANYNNTYDSLIDLFKINVEKYPDNIALIHNDCNISYKELWTKAENFANYLYRYGVTKGMYIPICMGRSANLIIAILGVFMTGGIYIPLDPTLPKSRIKYMISDIDPNVLIVNNIHLPLIEVEKYTVVIPDMDCLDMFYFAQKLKTTY